MAARRKKDPGYRPTWSVYEPHRTSDHELLTDPTYFWFPGNVWNDLLEENYPRVAQEARAYHNEHDVEIPDVAHLPDASLEDIPGFFPDTLQPPSMTSDDSLTSSPTFEPHHPPTGSSKDAGSGFFGMFSSPAEPTADASSHHHHATSHVPTPADAASPGTGADAGGTSTISSPADTTTTTSTTTDTGGTSTTTDTSSPSSSDTGGSSPSSDPG